jgi:L-asparaginase / beta-aspartyl-peptidase
MALADLSVAEATERVRKKIESMGGSIGVVAIDRRGAIAMPFTGDGMYRASASGDDAIAVTIYRE